LDSGINDNGILGDWRSGPESVAASGSGEIHQIVAHVRNQETGIKGLNVYWRLITNKIREFDEEAEN
jgi:hypothetical protein